MTLFHHSLSTPFGLFSLAVAPNGALVATAFGRLEALAARLGHLRPECRWAGDASRTALATAQFDAYFHGRLLSFDLPLAPNGSPFQHRVWAALQQIPFGETRTYAQLARQLGTSPRAIGRANATNPICVVIPCHRVIGADGSLTGFAFGEAVKQRLLDLESTRPAAIELGLEECLSVPR